MHLQGLTTHDNFGHKMAMGLDFSESTQIRDWATCTLTTESSQYRQQTFIIKCNLLENALL
jgi:hypothetical protein